MLPKTSKLGPKCRRTPRVPLNSVPPTSAAAVVLPPVAVEEPVSADSPEATTAVGAAVPESAASPAAVVMPGMAVKGPRAEVVYRNSPKTSQSAFYL